MAVKDIFKFNRKTFFNPTGWIDWNRIVEQNRIIWSVLKNMFYPAVPEKQRSFEQAIKEFGLNEADIADGISTYRTLALIFLLLGCATLFYAVYLLARHASVLGMFLAVAVSLFFFAQTFKYDFWALQMRRRQLGLTFADWKRYYLG